MSLDPRSESPPSLPGRGAGSRARSDGGDIAGSMKAGVAAGENPFPE